MVGVWVILYLVISRVALGFVDGMWKVVFVISARVQVCQFLVKLVNGENLGLVCWEEMI